MHLFSVRRARLLSSALACAAAFLGAAGCHHNNQVSGFGITWFTLTDTQGEFAAYQVNVDSVTLTGKVVGPITAVGAVETVDFTKLKDISELWSSASIPNDIYTSASITLDYTAANIAVVKDGVPIKAKVVDPSGAAVTTQTINITFDANRSLVVQPTFASTSAQRLALNFDLAASNVVNLATATPTVTIRPFMTASVSSSDTKPVRVRGPLINSSVNLQTYTVYVRPFFDEINSLGSVTMFGNEKTVYLINGTTFIGAAGLSLLSQSSAGTTITAAYTTYEPTPDTAQGTSAAKFNANYVVAGSTLEDFYTQGLEGDVIARTGNTLTVRGATVQFNDGTSIYYEDNTTVILGAKTIVTADDNPALTNLDYNSVSVGQHIIARGLYELSSAGLVTLDATGSSSTNTGSVRLISTPLFGSVVSAGAGTVVLSLDNIGIWPATTFKFDGNGATPVDLTNYVVQTGSLALPAGTGAGTPLFIDGVTAPFGSAPPDFEAFSINTELSVPATLQVDWTSAGTTTPFTTATSAGIIVNLANTHLSSAVIRIGEESIDLKALGTSPKIVSAVVPAGTSGLPAAFLPRFSIGGLTSAGVMTIASYNNLSNFLAFQQTHVVAATPALHLVADGYYNRAANTFTASSIDLVN